MERSTGKELEDHDGEEVEGQVGDEVVARTAVDSLVVEVRTHRLPRSYDEQMEGLRERLRNAPY